MPLGYENIMSLTWFIVQSTALMDFVVGRKVEAES